MRICGGGRSSARGAGWWREEPRRQSRGLLGSVSLNDTQDRILEAGPLRVRFTWQGDRFAHEVSVLRDGAWHPELVSVEGTPEDDWPPSPPFQSLHIEEREDGRTLALLVGMAGKSHWSASIEIDAEARAVLFDVACRLRSPAAGPLGSTYQSRTSQDSTLVPLVVELTHRFGPARLEPTGPRSAVLAEPAGDECPQTVRWDYRLRHTAGV